MQRLAKLVCFVIVLLVVFPPHLLKAQSWTYPGCPAPITDADFQYTVLMQHGKSPDPSLAEPDKMDFDMDAQGNVDIYFTEIRPGNIKRYSAVTKTVKTLIKLPNWGGSSTDYLTVKNSNHVEEGVTGIALDPNFKINHWLYVHWSPLPATAPTFRVSRFTVVGDTILMNSEKVLLSIDAQRDECCHTGGSMAFDDYGDLWIAQGANGGRGSNSPTGTPPVGMDEVHRYASEEWGASSTHGMRGGFLRIHPDNSVKGYSIPAGNFGEYFAKQTGNQDYLDTSKVLPEIYIKGTRNNYSMALDPVRRWVAWGDVGPDVMPTAVREEVNLRKTPGFEGWPYFVGNNTVFSGNKNPSAPTNTSKWNTGLTTLPPARSATRLPNIGPNPISGPIYRYDGDSKSKVKLPPHFTRKWFICDWATRAFQVLTLDSAGNTVTASQPIFTNFDFSGPVDFRAGPDGALYVSDYGGTLFGVADNTQIVKISYAGTCRPNEPKLEKIEASGIGDPNSEAATDRLGYLINLRSGQFISVPAGMVGFELYNMAGKKIWESGSLKAKVSFQLPTQLAYGALKYRWKRS